MDSATQALLENDYAVIPCPGDLSGKISYIDRTRMSERNMDTIEFPIERNLPRCPSSGALLMGQIQRLGRNSTDRRYVMKLQSDGKEFPVLVADHQSSWRVTGGSTTSRFIIRSFKDDSVLGSLTRSGTVVRDQTITYTLTHRSFRHCPIAYIRYEVPTVMQVLKECPPRRVFLEVPGRGTAESKEPTVHGKSHQKSLDFRGRGKQASRKNMQLQNKDGRVVLQFVKWEKDVFNLDFA